MEALYEKRFFLTRYGVINKKWNVFADYIKGSINLLWKTIYKHFQDIISTFRSENRRISYTSGIDESFNWRNFFQLEIIDMIYSLEHPIETAEGNGEIAQEGIK